ncbi:MAG TPA: hypothetical protein VLG25_01655 [Patescibacteria group bacterium]|nr:hypothetical protein [Patescibacteria group bacterium]
MADLRERILGTCLKRAVPKYKNGYSNNELDITQIKKDKLLFNDIVHELGERVSALSVSAIIGVPETGTWLSEQLKDKVRDRYCIKVSRDPTYPPKPDFFFRNVADRMLCSVAERSAIIDGVIDGDSGIRQMLAIPEIGVNAVGAVVVWDKSLSEKHPKLHIPFQALITEEIPQVIPDNSELWTYRS